MNLLIFQCINIILMYYFNSIFQFGTYMNPVKSKVSSMNLVWYLSAHAMWNNYCICVIQLSVFILAVNINYCLFVSIISSVYFSSVVWVSFFLAWISAKKKKTLFLFLLRVLTKNSFLNLINFDQMYNVIQLFHLIWHQTEFSFCKCSRFYTSI